MLCMTTKTKNVFFVFICLLMILQTGGSCVDQNGNYCGLCRKTFSTCHCCIRQQKFSEIIQYDTYYSNFEYYCSPCPAGEYKTSEFHFGYCDACPLGKYHHATVSGASSCSHCGVGTYGSGVRVLPTGSDIVSICPRC
jgi:hypothetical protein